jgi:chemotaxis protein CheD
VSVDQPWAPPQEGAEKTGRASSPETRYVRVGISEFAVSANPDEVLTTIALGSCVAVCLFDPVAGVGGLLHFLLPDSKLNPARAQTQPAAFADTGIAALFHAAYALGAQKKRCRVRLVGGAEIAAGAAGTNGDDVFQVGRRNVLAARAVLWRNGTLINGELVGGASARTITMAVADGRVAVKSDGRVVAEI